VQPRWHAAVHDFHGAWLEVTVHDRTAAEQARRFVEWPLRRRQPNPLQGWRRAFPNRFQTLEREEQVRAALGRQERVDLVHDHRSHAGEVPRRLRAEQEVERLRRGDEQVTAALQKAGALARRRVPRADRHVRLAYAQA
jgi:hypothetical protein